MPRPPKLNLEQRIEVRRRALAGENQAVIAAEFGITRAYVSVLKHKDPNATPQRMTDVRIGAQVIERVLPENNRSLPIQVCERLNARLSVAACAARSQRAEEGSQERLYAACKNCPTGRKNARAMGAA